jgi:hypothetical protein
MPAQLLKCIDFATIPVGSGPNPRVIQAVRFAVFNSAGAPLASSQIKSQGTFRGLDAGFRLEITFRRPVRAVCMSLVHFARAPRVAFFSAAGNNVGTATLAQTQAVAQEVVCTSTAIQRIVVRPPSDETLLLALCFG